MHCFHLRRKNSKDRAGIDQIKWSLYQRWHVCFCNPCAERIELARACAKTVLVHYKSLYISLPSSAPYACKTETARTTPFKKCVYIILLWNFTFCLDLFSKLYVCRYWNLPLLNTLRMCSVSNRNMGLIKCIGFYSEALKRRENSSNCAQTVFSNSEHLPTLD